jgi:hypothetical protein
MLSVASSPTSTSGSPPSRTKAIGSQVTGGKKWGPGHAARCCTGPNAAVRLKVGADSPTATKNRPERYVVNPGAVPSAPPRLSFPERSRDLILHWLHQIGHHSTRRGLDESFNRHAGDEFQAFETYQLAVRNWMRTE